MWCTASFAIAAGRALVKTHEGWRFVPEESLPAGAVRQTLTLDPISLSVSDDAVTTWTPAPRGSHIRLFRRELGPEHTRAMTDALNALFRELPVE
jgi:hypothetical protein